MIGSEQDTSEGVGEVSKVGRLNQSSLEGVTISVPRRAKIRLAGFVW